MSEPRKGDARLVRDWEGWERVPLLGRPVLVPVKRQMWNGREWVEQ